MIGCRLLVVGSFGWKPIPSEARVTRDKVSGYKKTYIQLSGRQYLIHAYIRYCLPDSFLFIIFKSRDFVPGYSRCARYRLPA